jgi:hypothetical protein
MENTMKLETVKTFTLIAAIFVGGAAFADPSSTSVVNRNNEEVSTHNYVDGSLSVQPHAETDGIGAQTELNRNGAAISTHNYVDGSLVVGETQNDQHGHENAGDSETAGRM